VSTHSIIARTEGDRFRGVYCHADGSPGGVGKALWRLYHGHFARDLARMMRTLVDVHVGWSAIVDHDFAHAPGYIELRPGAHDRYLHDPRPRCYCHGDRRAGPEGYRLDSTDDADAEWAYAINERTRLMYVYRAHGLPTRWTCLAAVDLEGE